MANEKIKEQIRQLETDYYIFLAEIIEGNLHHGEDDFSAWLSDELPLWVGKLKATLAELKKYNAFIKKEKPEDVEDIIAWLGFDEKNGVREFIASGMELLQNRIRRLECNIEAKEAIGVSANGEDIKNLLEHGRKLNRVRSYLNNFDENFKNDRQLLEKYIFEGGNL